MSFKYFLVDLWVVLLLEHRTLKSAVVLRLTGMPKEKYDPPDPRRCYTIMSAEEATSGKKAQWSELEISGQSQSLPQCLFEMTILEAQV